MSESTVDSHEHSDLISVLTTLVVFAMISMSLYYFLLKPILHVGDNNRPAARGETAALRQRNVPLQQQFLFNSHHRDQQQQQYLYDSEVLSLLAESTRYPPHVSLTAARQAGMGGSAVLVDGLVRFRHGRAASYEQQDDVSKNRRERARVLARLLALNNNSKNSNSTAPPPPARGSTVVVSIPQEHVDCPKLRRVLFLLSTFYNLFCILSFDTKVSAEQMSGVIAKLRGNAKEEELPTEVLPDHRIVAAQSVTGRVAFVRQLARVEFVLDFEPQVRTQLSRFGFQVFVYGNSDDDNGDGVYSPLGKLLLP